MSDLTFAHIERLTGFALGISTCLSCIGPSPK